MAVTTYGVNDALAVKLWARKLSVEALKATPIAPLIGSSANSVIHLKSETNKTEGDKITFGLRTQLSGQGVTEGQTLEGNEEALSTYSDSVYINELAHAVRVKNTGTIDAQRVPFNLRSESKEGLRDWYAKRMSVTMFAHLCGYTGDAFALDRLSFDPDLAVFNGNNSVTAPSSGRHIFADTGGDGNTTDQSLASDDTFTLSLIDYAKELAETATTPIRPIKVNGEDKYVMYLHPYQVTDMRTAAGAGEWLEITKAIYQGAAGSNPIYSGALGEYNGVILRKANDVMPGVNSSSGASISTVRRAVLLGAQAGAIAFGKGRSATNYRWEEELFDYKRELGVSVQTILGMKKCIFDSEDFGSVVVSTYAAAHT
jgi:N4-gp56 family major capsid protein